MTRSRGTLPAAAAGVLLVVLVEVTLALGPRDRHPVLLGCAVLACWVVFALSQPLLRRVPVERAVPLILAVGALLQVVAACWPPRTSDDIFRYAWDGRVSNHGIDPYAYPPDAIRLVRLHVPWLFPPGGGTFINRPNVPTIYPPVSQLWFRLVDAVTPDSWGIVSFQVAASLVAIAGSLVLVRLLRSLGRDPRLVAWWAWCPLVVFELGNNGHVDGLAAVLTVAALALVARRRSTLGGALLGAAIGVKLIPVVVLPTVLRRRPLRVLAAAAAVLAVSYLPHLLSVGTSVVGYLPGYLGEEGYDTGTRFDLLRLVLPESWAAPAAVAVAVIAAGLAALWANPDDPWPAAAVMAGVALLVATPSYPWYALLLVALATAASRPEWLVVAAAGYVSYLGAWTRWDAGQLRQLAYGFALLVVVASTVYRLSVRLRSRRSTRTPSPRASPQSFLQAPEPQPGGTHTSPRT